MGAAEEPKLQRQQAPRPTLDEPEVEPTQQHGHATEATTPRRPGARPPLLRVPSDVSESATALVDAANSPFALTLEGKRERTVLSPVLHASRKSGKGALSELSDRVGRMGDEIGHRLLRGLACSPREQHPDKKSQWPSEHNKPATARNQPPAAGDGFGGLLARTASAMRDAVGEAVESSKENASGLAVETASKLKGAAAGIFGKGERWVPPRAEEGEQVPAPRACCTAVLYHSRPTSPPCLLVFGGLVADGLCGQLWSCELPAGPWRKLNPAGAPPPPRAAHTAVVYGGAMWVHGGHGECEGQDTLLGDLYRLDTSAPICNSGANWRWARVRAGGEAPAPRCSHVAAAVGGALYIFGGEGAAAPPREEAGTHAEGLGSCTDATSPEGGTILSAATPGSPYFRMLNDLRVLPLTSLTTGGEWSEVARSGPSPCARSGAAACATGGCLYLFGGSDGAKRELDDLWAFDPTRGYWAELAIGRMCARTRQPSACASAALAALPGRLLLFGGCDRTGQLNQLFQFTLAEGGGGGAGAIGEKSGGGGSPLSPEEARAADCWQMLELPGRSPQGRSSHTMLTHATAQAERLFIFGGFDGNTFLSDLVYAEQRR